MQITPGVHYFGESVGYGWHRYPDGRVIKVPADIGYAEAWARAYRATGRRARVVCTGEEWQAAFGGVING